MTEKRYMIKMQTIFGEKKGEMYFFKEKDKISGTIDILHHNNFIEGILSDNGELNITGSITTLMREIPFTAEGLIDHEKLQMTVYTNSSNYSIKGIEIHDDK